MLSGKQRGQLSKMAGRFRADSLAHRRSSLDPDEIQKSPLGSILDHCHVMLLCDADVVAALRLHLRKYVHFRHAQIDAERMPRLGVAILEFRRLKAVHETRQTLPARLYTQVADLLRFGEP